MDNDNEQCANDEFIPETLEERLWGLTEIFPQSIVDKACYVGKITKRHCKIALHYGRTYGWMIGSSAAILFIPLITHRELQKKC
ncbi:mitochondrial import receptor subunit TOM22 homolog [Daktulosphaira vitifoliae]|uniref:mitochondrial import receptor subunit TOM22 homolog n=1 Tax=Daktulosphaira vitifoliae TaxID=58002 RepID=UPI0021AA65D7|nr:mitochondrial import receptor subunit TOM22 homolog [Daktulosphaira vitifoliae]